MSVEQIIKQQVDQVFEDANLAAAIEPPEVFRDRDQQASPAQLGEWAGYIASQREYVAEVLQHAQHTLDLCKSMLQTLEDSAQDDFNQELATQAGYLINRGFAAQERMAQAKVSQLERSVEIRAARLQTERLEAMVRQLRHVHGEWRAAEFTLDRMVRITQLRLTISEV